MSHNRNQDRHPRHHAVAKHLDEWQKELNPNHLAGQNAGEPPDAAAPAGRRSISGSGSGTAAGSTITA